MHILQSLSLNESLHLSAVPSCLLSPHGLSLCLFVLHSHGTGPESRYGKINKHFAIAWLINTRSAPPRIRKTREDRENKQCIQWKLQRGSSGQLRSPLLSDTFYGKRKKIVQLAIYFSIFEQKFVQKFSVHCNNVVGKYFKILFASNIQIWNECNFPEGKPHMLFVLVHTSDWGVVKPCCSDVFFFCPPTVSPWAAEATTRSVHIPRPQCFGSCVAPVQVNRVGLQVPPQSHTMHAVVAIKG